jgi:hypothetical protein
MVYTNKGYYKTRLLGRDFRRFVFRGIRDWHNKYLKGKMLWALLLIASFTYGVYVRAEPVVRYSAFGASDLYTYVEWVKAIFEGDVFNRGVYPFAMQNIIAGMGTLTGINVVTITRMLGISVFLFTMVGVYWVVHCLFNNHWTSLVAAAIFGCIMTPTSSYWRQSFPLSQELSQMYWVIVAGFFIRLLDGDRKIDLYGFTFALLGIVLAHPYGLITAALFCIGYFIVYIGKIFSNKALLFRRLVASVAIAFIVGAIPLGVGFAKGKTLDGSFTWGMTVISGDETFDWESFVMEGDGVSSGNGTTNADPSAPEGEPLVIPEGFVPFVEFYVERAMSENRATFLTLVIALPICLVLLISKKTRRLGLRVSGITVYSWLMFFLITGTYLGIPALMDSGRATMFYSVMDCSMYVLPVGVIATFFKRGRNALSFLLSMSILSFLYVNYGFKNPVTTNTMTQKEGAVRAYYQIIDEYPTGEWTVVSPVEEYALVLHEGYHYELVDFLTAIDDYNPSKEFFIPTDYVFFYIEKLPFRLEDYSTPLPLNPDDAYEPLRVNKAGELVSNIYKGNDSRMIMEAKINLWCEVYARHFPDDMRVIYEDDEMKVYCFKQNMYKYSNLAIDYGGNSYDGKKDAPK